MTSIKNAAEWVSFSERYPDKDCQIWIAIIGESQVSLAHYEMNRSMDEEDPDPGISNIPEDWLGTDQPTHWMLAEIPAPPRKTK